MRGYPTAIPINLTRTATTMALPIEVTGSPIFGAPLPPGQPLPPGTFTIKPETAAAGAASASFTLTPGPAAPDGPLTLLVQGKTKINNVDKIVFGQVAALTDQAGTDEKIATGPKSAGVIYWQVAKNHTLDSTIGKTMGKKRYKSSTTTRNLRTLVKVLAAQPSS